MKLKQWITRISKAFYTRLVSVSLLYVAKWHNYKNKTNHTYRFFYSLEQDLVTDNLVLFDSNGDSIPFPKCSFLYKGQLYSEMKQINKGWSNWDDAIFLGYGSDKDLSLKQ